VPSVNQNPVTSATALFYTVFEHMEWNAPTLAASSRVTLDFEENMYGHRSGIQTPSSGGGSVVSGPGGTAGVQTVATAYVQTSWPAPNVTVALPRIQAGMGESYTEQLQFRQNPENA
jgi:hypothetical protein